MKVLCLGVLLALCSLVAGSLLTKDVTNARSFFHNYHDIGYSGGKQSASEVLITEIVWNALIRLRNAVIEEGGLPPMDPLAIGNVGPYEINTSSGSLLKASLRDFKVEGLSQYEVDSVTLKPLRGIVGVSLNVPSVLLTGDYDAEMRVMTFIQQASGKARLTVDDLYVDIVAKMGATLSGGYLVIRELKVDIEVQNISLAIEDMQGSPLVTAVLIAYVENFTPEYVQSQLPVFNEALSNSLLEIFNDIFRMFSLTELLCESVYEKK